MSSIPTSTSTNPPPIHLLPLTPSPNPAALILLHGLDDDALPFSNIAQQFRAAGKLPHMHWVMPTAPFDTELMQRAWYRPSPLRIFAKPRDEEDEEEREDEEGLVRSRGVVEGLVGELVERHGVPVGRIVLAGFSQGCAVALLTGLTSALYADKIAGIVGLAGYLPLADKIEQLRRQSGLSEKVAEGGVPVLVTRGGRDLLVPKRYLRLCREKLGEMGWEEREDGKGKGKLEVREYEGLGHVISAGVLRDLCAWLERVVPG